MTNPTRNEELLLQAIESAQKVVSSLASTIRDMESQSEQLRRRIEKLEQHFNVRKAPF